MFGNINKTNATCDRCNYFYVISDGYCSKCGKFHPTMGITSESAMKDIFNGLMEILQTKLRPNLAYVDINANMLQEVDGLMEGLTPLFEQAGWSIQKISASMHCYIRARKIEVSTPETIPEATGSNPEVP